MQPPLREIVDVWVTRWNLDPLTGGVYSTLAIGGSPETRRTLATAVSSRLVLAGEYTSVDFPATMHGAFHSGQYAARQLDLQPGQHCVVVGAGLAGLSAARDLAARGVRVTVLEATEFLGGRARVEQRPSGVPFHPGAAWIHGTVGNPIAELAGAAGLIAPAWPSHSDATAHVNAAGEALPQYEVESINTLHDRILENLQKRALAARMAGEPDSAVRGPLREELLAIEDGATRVAVAGMLQQHFESLMAGFLDDISFHYGDEPFEYPGGDAYLHSPLSGLLQLLRGQQVVQYGVVVKRITHDPNGANGVSVHTDTEVITADGCVIATSVTPLQTGLLQLDPPFPPDHQTALSMIRMGKKAKVFVQFTERWWGEKEQIRVAPPKTFGDPTDTSIIGTWVDASNICGVPVLCGFIGGAQALALQTASDVELRSYVANAVAQLP